MLDLLQGIRVVSFNHFLLGPLGIQALGDLGADVIAVESVDGAWQRHWSGANAWRDGQSLLFLCANRNKRSLALDLKSEAGRAVALKLVDTADVVAENFRPGIMERLGLGYEALRARRPSLVYASASGYGPDGPYAEKPGQDLLAQALFGLMAITGQAASGPRPVGVSAADHHGAALFALGIVAALLRRSRTGQGCRVDANLMQAALDLQAESLVA
jgi:crotonobetainyl-CoA:carnitine CoA-transferase CaiB-like acyl-CoA transferase